MGKKHDANKKNADVSKRNTGDSRKNISGNRSAAGQGKAVQGKLISEKSERWSFLGILTSISVVIILVGMQLYYHDYYYDILITKYRFYCVCAIGYVVLCLCGVLVTQRKQLAGLKGKKFQEIFDGTDLMVLAFTAIALISTALSPFKWEAFWGNEGRYTGAFLLLIYAAYYFCSTRFYHQRSWHMQAFLIAGILMCLFGITDSFNMDLLGFKVDMIDTQRDSFTSTIGNINTYTACVAMVMAVAAVLFASGKGIVRNIWYGALTLISFAALIIGESDNAYLSLATLFGFLPLYLFRDRRGVRKYVTLLAMFFTVVYGIGIEQKVFEGTVIPIRSLFVTISGFSKLPHFTVGLWILALVLFVTEMLGDRKGQKQKENEAPAGKLSEATQGKPAEKLSKITQEKPAAKLSEATQEKPEGQQKNQAQRNDPAKQAGPRRFYPLVYVWWAVIAVTACVVIWVLYDVNVAGHVEKYAGFEKYLLFNDNWGTHRGFAWRIAVENYKQFPLAQKIFGYGPDTFSLVTYFNNYAEMTGKYNELFDSVHNEYLQYLVTVGPLGLGAYLGIIGMLTWNTVKKKLDNPIAVGCLFAVLCYGVQASVNINQPIATPIMWTLLCVTAAKRGKDIK